MFCADLSAEDIFEILSPEDVRRLRDDGDGSARSLRRILEEVVATLRAVPCGGVHPESLESSCPGSSFLPKDHTST